jgi:hypothetical protein
MAVRQLLSTLAILFAVPAAVSAQHLAGPSPSVLFARQPQASLYPALAAPDTIRTGIRPTYWKEGALIGGLVGGLGLGLFAAELCRFSEQPSNGCVGTTLLTALVGTVIVGIPGALIGGSFPKYPKNTRVIDPEGVPDRPSDTR